MIFRNVGLFDRLVRLSLGVLMLGLGWQASDWLAAPPLRIFAIYPLLTALLGWCPVYALFRYSSR